MMFKQDAINKANKNKVLCDAVRKVALAGLLTLTCTNAMAIDTNLSLHKGFDAKTAGISVGVSDNFSKGSAWFWSVAYSNLNDVQVSWNNDQLYFKNDSLDVAVSYRQKLKSYNEFFKKVTIEYKLGASVALTENKFVWQALDEEKYFSEKNDVNALVAVSAYYNFNKKTAVTVGLKYQPNFSEFGNVSTVFIGINYKFGRVAGY